MLSKTIFAAASIFLAVTAIPTPDVEVEARNTPPPPPAACGNVLEEQCCFSIISQVIAGLTVPVGIGCVNILASGCSQPTACCATGNQIGLINVAVPVCPVLL
ncbi:hypothetical protein MMC14_009611 [Varicellaria rhodocarpa]|nr:hypothetical protein [Varicellaria rhodocarpa]